MEAKPPRLTDFTCYRAEKDARLMAAIDKVVAMHPDAELNDEAGHNAYNDMVCCAMSAYYDAGRLDVDNDGEYIGVTLMDCYRFDGHALTGAALKKFLIEAIAETATSYIG